MSEWTAGEWVFVAVWGLGGIVGYAILIVYVFVLKHNMPEQWEDIKKHRKEVADELKEYKRELAEELKALRETVYECERKVTKEIAVKHAVSEWAALEKKGSAG